MRLPDHGIKCLGSVLSGGDDEFFHEDQKYEKGNSEIVNPKIANPQSQLPVISLLEFFLVWDFFRLLDFSLFGISVLELANAVPGAV